MALAIFDLDNTLLAGDSDYLWGRFLLEQGLVDSDYDAKNKAFYKEYEAGNLDIFEFLEFQLAFLAKYPKNQLETWRRQFLREKIQPIMLPKARQLVDAHRQQGDTLVIITATNSFITRPISEMFQIPNLLATEPEMIQGRYTGRVDGIPCFQSGKITRLQAWLEQQDRDMQGSYFYSDSHNDLPLLQKVDHPFAVNPDERLMQHAKQHNWDILDLRS